MERTADKGTESRGPNRQQEPAPEVLRPEELRLIDAYWRAANYLAVGQIYLLANPLLREPLRAEHVKPRLLGHRGTTPGLNLIYAHLNRVIRNWDLDGCGSFEDRMIRAGRCEAAGLIASGDHAAGGSGLR